MNDKHESVKDQLVKMQEKMNESFSKDDKADPKTVERLNQIFHDAIASFPADPPPEPEDPTQAILKRMDTELKAIADDPTTPKDMAKDAKQAASTIEGMEKKEEKKAEKVPEPAHATPAQTPPKK